MSEDDQFIYAVHKCLMHAIGFKDGSIVSQAHVCVNLEDITTLDKSVFCVLTHSIPKDFVFRVAQEIT